jgi:allantoin racemase
MPKVLVIVPFPMSDENRALRRAQVHAVKLGRDIAFQFESVRVAPKHYVSAADMALADFGVMQAGLDAQARGFDAVCIDTMSDSGVAALRSALDIPVIGPGRVSMLTALMFADRFSILAMWPHWTHLYTRTLRDLRLTDHCASVRWIEGQPDNQGLLGDKADETVAALEKVAWRCIEEDGAQAILLGSTTMHEAHAALAAALPVPVINPGPLTYKLAEAALGLGLTHGRAAYPASPDLPTDIIEGMTP